MGRLEDKATKSLNGKAAVVTGSYGANLRRSPGLSRKALQLLATGQEITIYPQFTETVDNYDWVAANSGEVYGFVARPLIKTIDAITDRIHIGIHFADSGDTGDIIPTLEAMAAGSYSPACALVVNDVGLCKRIKEIDKNILVAYRYVASDHDPVPFDNLTNDGGGTVPSGRSWFDTMWKHHEAAAPYANFHQMYNEPGFAFNVQNAMYARRVATFEREFLGRCDELNVKGLFGTYLPGTPEARHLDEMKDTYSYAERNGHWLCYHAYDSPEEDKGFFTVNSKGEPTVDFFGLRPMKWLDKNFPRLNVFAGEVGHYKAPRYRGEQDFRALLWEMQTMGVMTNTAQRRWVFAAWTAKGQNDKNWKYDDFTPAVRTVFAPVCKEIAGK